MISTLGIDHGTRAIRAAVLPDGEFFEIERYRARKVSIMDEVRDNIDLIGLSYSMGDGIDGITPSTDVANRGQKEETTGEYVGGGTNVFDEVAASEVPAVLIPGLHRGITCLDPRFRALYSHMASAEKVAIGYHAYLETGAEDMVIADISSNTVTIGIKDGHFFGAMDACLGAPGILHGPLDLEAIRRIDSGEVTANKAFYQAGIGRIARTWDFTEILTGKTDEAKEAMDALILAARMEVMGFIDVIRPDVIVITGGGGVADSVFEPLKESLEAHGEVIKVGVYSAALGASEIARDILAGRKDFLGIPYKG